MPDDSKHKKKTKVPLSATAFIENITAFMKSIASLGHKQQYILNEWLRTWSRYIIFEKTFDPMRLIYYHREDIVLVDLGYNVGNNTPCGSYKKRYNLRGWMRERRKPLLYHKGFGSLIRFKGGSSFMTASVFSSSRP